MNEIQLIKDELALLSIHPEKGWVRRRENMGYALMTAALCDLALMGKLQVIQGKINATSTVIGDPLIDELAIRLNKLNGRKLWWFISGRTLGASATYRKQMRLLETKRMINSTPVEWLGITLGRRYRVNHKYNTSTLINRLERVLIYGRVPDLRLRVLIELLVVLDMIGVFFSQGELRKRAKQRGKEICKHGFSESDETFVTIFKELRAVLKVAGSHNP
ncbi:MAG: GPP34 family phosphoprotein [Bacteroidales bacterium]|nr:GPP34 family phosphoprotein [Bacteroidales bacterium]MDZ4205093.1 GPP34 family phosphoprotein [Bacteroidales bacterium]